MEKNIEEIFGTKRSNGNAFAAYKPIDQYDEIYYEI